MQTAKCVEYCSSSEAIPPRQSEHPEIRAAGDNQLYRVSANLSQVCFLVFSKVQILGVVLKNSRKLLFENKFKSS